MAGDQRNRKPRPVRHPVCINPRAVTETRAPASHLGIKGRARTSGISHQEVGFDSQRQNFPTREGPGVEEPFPAGNELPVAAGVQAQEGLL